ncbi:MAG: LytTR family DNA-binding domain-containing protein [Bacteroidota bacterium]
MMIRILREHKILTHVLFWVIYYFAFSIIWAQNGEYYPSFFLEFALMPVRIGLCYYTIYYLIPKILRKQKIILFFSYYGIALFVAGSVQSVITYFFYESVFQTALHYMLSIGSIFRSMLLVNSTVLFLSAFKLYQLWQEELTKNDQPPVHYINIKADKRTYRIKMDHILYVEGWGNYLKLVLKDGNQLISYSSLKELEQMLPKNFVRTHKSYIVNKDKISSFTKENLAIDDKFIPISKNVTLENFLQIH